MRCSSAGPARVQSPAARRGGGGPTGTVGWRGTGVARARMNFPRPDMGLSGLQIRPEGAVRNVFFINLLDCGFNYSEL